MKVPQINVSELEGDIFDKIRGPPVDRTMS